MYTLTKNQHSHSREELIQDNLFSISYNKDVSTPFAESTSAVQKRIKMGRSLRSAGSSSVCQRGSMPNKLLEDTSLGIAKISELDQKLHTDFKDKIQLDTTLSRSLVSFQANKSAAFYKWYKYKEGFSAALIEVLFNRYNIHNGPVLDPFAGSGATLFVSSEKGMDSDGIELLPIGQKIIHARDIVRKGLTKKELTNLTIWAKTTPWRKAKGFKNLNEIRITAGAYPQNTKKQIEQYLYWAESLDAKLKMISIFALLCVLENISYTRKDGQYLRWDSRAHTRNLRTPFSKGVILDFEKAIVSKITEIIADIQNATRPESLGFDIRKSTPAEGNVQLFSGSCLNIMQKLQSNHYQCIFTSPPYCNRYDYTRTYALELALLGADEKTIRDLRQAMLSCTVENRAKDLISINPGWEKAIQATDSQKLLQTILKYLETQKEAKVLNNTGIPRMVRGYFYEMSCVLIESFRVLKKGAYLIMVNDNVRYAGASISVDLILSDIARKIGFEIEKILILPIGKGNSSQQMGEHGRTALRKCIYIWRKS